MGPTVMTTVSREEYSPPRTSRMIARYTELVASRVPSGPEAGLAVRRLRERQQLVGRHPEYVRDVAVPALVGVPESVVMGCEVPIGAVLLANRVGQRCQHRFAGYAFGCAFHDNVEAVVPGVRAC